MTDGSVTATALKALLKERRLATPRLASGAGVVTARHVPGVTTEDAMAEPGAALPEFVTVVGR